MNARLTAVTWRSFIGAAAIAILLTLLGGQPIYAQDTETTETNESIELTEEASADADSFVPESYDYEVQECNNFTLLVRRSIQLYDSATANVELSEAAVIYAETNIVQELNGSDLILPGQKISVPSEIVAKYASQSDELTGAQVAAWQAYANNASFELEDIEARNVAQEADGTTVEVDQNGDQVSVTDTTDTSDEEQSEETEDDEGDGIGWWIVGAGAVGTLWYLLWYRGNDEE